MDAQKTAHVVRGKNKRKENNPFVKLDALDNVEARWNEFQKVNAKRRQMETEALQMPKIDNVVEFVKQPWENTGKIPTGIIMSSYDISNQHRLFEQIESKMDNDTVLASLHSADCTTIKSALKTICTAVAPGFTKSIDLDMVDFDDKVLVVLIKDAASFDNSLLTQLIRQLHSHVVGGKPIKLLLNVATSIDIFQSKLPQWCIRLLHGVEFKIEQGDAVGILEESLSNLFLSVEVFDTLVEFGNVGINMLKSGLDYAYMVFYYTLSVTNARKHASFRKVVESMVDQGHMEDARELLENDERLRQEIETSRGAFEEYSKRVFLQINIAWCVYEALGEPATKTGLYRKVICGEKIDFASKSDQFTPESIQQVVEQLRGLGVEDQLEDATNMGSIRDYLMRLQLDLPPLHEIQLYEHFCITQADLLNQKFNPNFRGLLEADLSNRNMDHLQLLYQLYRESPVVMNVRDYYTAFHELANEPDEEKTLSYFLNGVAELKRMGLLLDSRRQYESLEKLMWKGL